MPELGAADVLEAVTQSQRVLVPAASGDWERRAGTLEWSCRRTLDHMADGQLGYAGRLATRAQGTLPAMRGGNPGQGVEDLLRVVDAAGIMVAQLIEALPPDARVFHPAGMADGPGYAAMACTESLLHTFDIAQGLHLEFRPPGELCARILARLFPWVSESDDPWAALCWASGRASLPGRDDVEADWWWHCAPLSEWDGTVKKRPAPTGAALVKRGIRKGAPPSGAP